MRSVTKLCGLRVSVELYVTPKMPITMQALRALWTYAAQLRLSTPLRSLWRLPSIRWMLYPARTAKVLWLRVKPHGELPGLCEVEEARAALAKQAPDCGHKSATAGQPGAPKSQRAGPFVEQMDLGDGWNQSSEGRVVKATTTPPTNPNMSP